jgi:iron-regulated transporter 1
MHRQVVVIAGEDAEALSVINSQMRRIDLLCKLFGPLFIALIDGYSSRVAIIVNFGMNAISVIVEYFAIARVYDQVPQLQEAKVRQPEQLATEPAKSRSGHAITIWEKLTGLVNKSGQDFYFYSKHRAFLPSIAGAVLYLTVLSFAGQMVTYLLSVGYNSTQIGIARTLSVVFEVLATWVAPFLMGRLGVIRAGLWLSTWQTMMLITGTVVFFTFETDSLISASGLVGGTILSRLGLRGFDLCVQFIVQEVRPPILF